MNPGISKGDVAEYLFAAALLDRGMVPCWPSTDSQPYDLVVDVGSERYRVQVKGTTKRGSSVHVPLIMRQGKKTRRYTKKDVDLVVLYLFEYDTWYIFPVSVVRSSVTIRPGSPRCRWKRYAAAWQHLDKKQKIG